MQYSNATGLLVAVKGVKISNPEAFGGINVRERSGK